MDAKTTNLLDAAADVTQLWSNHDIIDPDGGITDEAADALELLHQAVEDMVIEDEPRPTHDEDYPGDGALVEQPWIERGT
jgi:hypothetical protein